MNVIELENIKKVYGKNTAVNINKMTIKKGEVYGLIGPNEAGDSGIMMTDTINPVKSRFKGFHKTFKQDDLGLNLSFFLLN